MSPQPGKANSGTATDRRQRRHARYLANFPVVVTLFAGDEYRRMDAHCKDLSQAGIGILVAAELTMGEVASLHFLLPGESEPWELRAVLRHRRGYHYGFEFLSLSPTHLDSLSSYLKKQPRADGD